jgi:hypothetical protein
LRKKNAVFRTDTNSVSFYSIVLIISVSIVGLIYFQNIITILSLVEGFGHIQFLFVEEWYHPPGFSIKETPGHVERGPGVGGVILEPEQKIVFGVLQGVPMKRWNVHLLVKFIIGDLVPKRNGIDLGEQQLLTLRIGRVVIIQFEERCVGTLFGQGHVLGLGKPGGFVRVHPRLRFLIKEIKTQIQVTAVILAGSVDVRVWCVGITGCLVVLNRIEDLTQRFPVNLLKCIFPT